MKAAGPTQGRVVRPSLTEPLESALRDIAASPIAYRPTFGNDSRKATWGRLAARLVQLGLAEDGVRGHSATADGRAWLTPPAPFSGPDFARNEERAGELSPCALCGKGITPAGQDRCRWAQVVGGGSRFARVDEVVDPNDGGYMGWYPVGSECAKRFPRAYLTDDARHPCADQGEPVQGVVDGGALAEARIVRRRRGQAMHLTVEVADPKQHEAAMGAAAQAAGDWYSHRDGQWLALYQPRSASLSHEEACTGVVAAADRAAAAARELLHARGFTVQPARRPRRPETKPA